MHKSLLEFSGTSSQRIAVMVTLFGWSIQNGPSLLLLKDLWHSFIFPLFFNLEYLPVDILWISSWVLIISLIEQGLVDIYTITILDS